MAVANIMKFGSINRDKVLFIKICDIIDFASDDAKKEQGFCDKIENFILARLGELGEKRQFPSRINKDFSLDPIESRDGKHR